MGFGDLLVGTEPIFRQENRCLHFTLAMADILGIGLDEVGRAEVTIMGQAYRVVGLIDGEKIDEMRDLDNESPMPVDTVAEAQKMQEMANLDPRLWIRRLLRPLPICWRVTSSCCLPESD